jgi:hypothetical protein
MPAAQPLGNNQVEPGTARLIFAEAEKPRRRRVPEPDMSRRVGIDDRVGAIARQPREKILWQMVGHSGTPHRLIAAKATPLAASSGTGCSLGQ